MYWLLPEEKRDEVRKKISAVTLALSRVQGNPQIDQLFPYIGRKDRRKAEEVIRILTESHATVIDPFSGSGTFTYAAKNCDRNVRSNDWEPYAHRLSSAPWRLPAVSEIEEALEALLAGVKERMDYLYRTICTCGHVHVLDSLFFDLQPLRYVDVTPHERLGPDNENVTYRRNRRCPECGATEKHFDDTDRAHMDEISSAPIPLETSAIFSSPLIENSRINLSARFTVYGNLFPHRSKLALSVLWNAINDHDASDNIKDFFRDAFLAILMQAKYKDYRSKSQDLHVPNVQLREVNIMFRFEEQVMERSEKMNAFVFKNDGVLPIECADFRNFLDGLEPGNGQLVITDPPWTDGNAYFEKAQLYHPWLQYSLSTDADRLEKEMVVTDAPSRRRIHDVDRWWQDMSAFFVRSHRVLAENGYLALYFRPVPARKWIENLNRLKLAARQAGFEPLLSIDVESSDPSMRIQQSAKYVFSKDIVFVFLRLPAALARWYEGDRDMDHLVFRTSVEIQEREKSSYTYPVWRDAFEQVLHSENLGLLNAPSYEEKIYKTFLRYNSEVSVGIFLPKPQTPFSSQLFDVPAEQRLFTYVPLVIQELTRTNNVFTYDRFLLSLASFLENGTRELIGSVAEVDIKKLINPYAEPLEDGLHFQKRSLPALPQGLKNIVELEPYDFESFVAALLMAQGYTSVALIGRTGDRGVDVTALDPNGNTVVVQCKRYIGNNVGSEPVQRLHSFSVTRGAVRRMLITTSGFTPQGIDEARITNTELIDGTELERLIAQFLPEYFAEH